MHRHELTDAQWQRIELLLPVRQGPRTKRGDRNFINAVMWRVSTGAPWRDIPERYGSWKTIYNRFARWAARGAWEQIFKAVSGALKLIQSGGLKLIHPWLFIEPSVS